MAAPGTGKLAFLTQPRFAFLVVSEASIIYEPQFLRVQDRKETGSLVFPRRLWWQMASEGRPLDTRLTKYFTEKFPSFSSVFLLLIKPGFRDYGRKNFRPWASYLFIYLMPQNPDNFEFQEMEGQHPASPAC